MVGLPRVSFLIDMLLALSFANRRFRSLPNSSSFTLCSRTIALSISPIALWNFRLARSSTFCAFTNSSCDLYSSVFMETFRSSVMIWRKHCGRTTYIFG